MTTLAQAISDLTTLRTLPTDQALHLLAPSTAAQSNEKTTREILDGTGEQHETREYARAVEFLRLRREEGREDGEWGELREKVEGVAVERAGERAAGR